MIRSPWGTQLGGALRDVAHVAFNPLIFDGFRQFLVGTGVLADDQNARRALDDVLVPEQPVRW